MFRTEPLIETTRNLAPRDTSDGSPAELPIYLSRPAGADGGKRSGLILIQEIFGVNDHIQDVTNRFAAAGYVVAAPDILYRSGHWMRFNYDQASQAFPYFQALTEDLVMGDIQATYDHLVAQPDVDPNRIGVVGYCLGGRISFVTAARFGERIKASAIYYGGRIVGQQPEAPIHRAGSIRCPVIGFFGALDKHIPVEHVAALEARLSQAGVENQIYCYPYADHGFFCDARATFHPRAAEDAWYRTLTFFGTHLGPVPDVTWKAKDS